MQIFTFNELHLGQKAKRMHLVRQSDLQGFVDLSGDNNPLHTDLEYCKSLGMPNCVVHGLLTGAFFSALIGVDLPGKHARLLGIEFRYLKPVFVGDQLELHATIKNLSEATRTVELSLIALKSNDIRVLSGKALVEVLK